MLRFRVYSSSGHKQEVTENLKLKLDPVTAPLRIIQADGSALEIIGSVILYLEAEHEGEKKN